MADYEITRYTPSHIEEWDSFIDSSRNATFLLRRGYMDYHSDRFADHSMMVRKGGRLTALLPACETVDEAGRIVTSHAGLTYGGWVLPPRHVDAADVLRFFRILTEALAAEGVTRLDYKPIPYIYHRMPSQDDLYALFRLGATLSERNISCAIDLSANPGFNTLQKRNLKRSMALPAEIVETKDVAEFHSMLSGCLMDRHDTLPVHTAQELQMLRDRFPRNIRIFMAVSGGEPMAGVCVFDTGVTAHAQYICSTPRGRREGMLTRLFNSLTATFGHCRYFDFGISNEEHGLLLNEGLYRQKSSLGGSGVAYDRYTLPIAQEI